MKRNFYGQKIVCSYLAIVLERALMRRQIVSPPPSILRSWQKLPQRAAGELTVQTLCMLRSGRGIRVHNTKLVLLELPMIEERSRCSLSRLRMIPKGLVRTSITIHS